MLNASAADTYAAISYVWRQLRTGYSDNSELHLGKGTHVIQAFMDLADSAMLVIAGSHLDTKTQLAQHDVDNTTGSPKIKVTEFGVHLNETIQPI